MAKFKVTITETLTRDILISDADSIKEAEEKAEEIWLEQKVILGGDDFSGGTFSGMFMTEHRYAAALADGLEEY